MTSDFLEATEAVARRAQTYPKVRAIVLNYNGHPHVLQSVEALLQTEWPSDKLDVVVVDNRSTDGSVDDLRREFPDVEVRTSRTNFGFPANNLALEDRVGVDFFALINNDAFVEPGWLEPLVRELQGDPALGAASAKIVFAPRFGPVQIESETTTVPGDSRGLGVRLHGLRLDEREVWSAAQFGPGFYPVEKSHDGPYVWSSGEAELRIPFPVEAESGRGKVSLQLGAGEPREVTVRAGGAAHRIVVDNDPAWFHFDVDLELFDVVNNAGSVLIEGGFGGDRGFKRRDDGSFDEPTDVFAWCGNGVLLRPSYLEDVGLFDESFFAYYEDTDMAWRGRARGWRHRYVPKSRIRHMHATTSGEGSPLFHHYVERNRLLMLAKNAPSRLAAGAALRFLWSTLGYLRADVVHPLIHRRRPRPRPTMQRLRSFAAFGRMLPAALRQRSTNRRRQEVPDRELISWMISPEEHGG